MSILQVKTKILAGGRIEVETPGLKEGQAVTIHIEVEPDSPPLKRRTDDILAGYPGGRLFKTGAEVDQYIKEERESWGD